MLHYSFEGEEHAVLPRPHGNAKSQSAYVRTMPSTICKLREASQHLPPKCAVGEVTRSVGGLTGASSVSKLPRNRQQSSDCRRALFTPRSTTATSSSADPLFPVMVMCKESEGANSDPSSRFVRMVCNTPEPMTVLAFDWSLADLERFCTNPQHKVILSVDPTFNLGSFHVTVTTYRHPMLEYKHQRRGSHPVMFGPMFIHQRKLFATYNFFFSHLVGLRPNLRDVQCFGTDGEKALEEALHTQFRFATHLRCFLHFRGNIESKLADLGISKTNAQEFVRDIFGNPAMLEEGLVDADSADLDTEFDAFKAVWDARECSLTNTSQAHFHNWFRANSLEVVRKCMLKEKRQAAGLGSPPEPFYTNDVESKNRVLKEQTCYKPQQLPSFVQSMKSMFEDQKQEIDKAVVGLGEYQLCEEYQSYGVDTKEWFKKNQKQRERVLDRFAKAQLSTGVLGSASHMSTGDHHDGSSTSMTLSSTDLDHSSAQLETMVTDHLQDSPTTSNPLSKTSLPQPIKQSMWDKVLSYIEDESSYTKTPGVTDYSSILVKSTSGNRPHFVEKTSSNVYKCDKDCLMFKSTNGMCSHSLLAAALNGQVDTFVTHYSKAKAPVNYANLGQHGLPAGGKKPSKRKASSKKTTSAIKKILAHADDIQRSKRAKTAKTTTVTPMRHQHSSIQPASQHQASLTSVTEGISATVYNTGNTLNYIAPPSQPPPLLHVSPGSSQSPSSDFSVGQPFRLMFLNARISRCQGCRGQILQGCPSPQDLVFQHKEHVLFLNPNTGNWQLSRDLRNTYYHTLLRCLSAKHPDFTASEIQVSCDVRARLNSVHTSFLINEFGLAL